MSIEVLFNTYVPLFVWGHILCMIIITVLFIVILYNVKQIKMDYFPKLKPEEKEKNKNNKIELKKKETPIKKTSTSVNNIENFGVEQSFYDNYGHNNQVNIPDLYGVL
jgi:predicted membrane protein